MSASVLVDAYLCYPPPKLNDAYLGAIGADVPLLCYTPCTAVSVSAAHICLFLLRFVRALLIYPPVRLGAALILRFWWMVPFLPLPSYYTAS